MFLVMKPKNTFSGTSRAFDEEFGRDEPQHRSGESEGVAGEAG